MGLYEMKHLNNFTEFILEEINWSATSNKYSNTELEKDYSIIEQTLEDIFLEATDLGLTYKMWRFVGQTLEKKNVFDIDISVGNIKNETQKKVVGSIIERVNEYLQTFGFQFKNGLLMKHFPVIPGYSVRQEKEYITDIQEIIKLDNEIGEIPSVSLVFTKNIEVIQESLHPGTMTMKYGSEVLDECDEVIQNIKDMLLELEDDGIQSYVYYSPMTFVCREESPKIVVDINADEGLFASKIQDIHNVTDRIKSYVKSLRFVTGEGTWTTDSNMTRQILIQK